MKKIFSLILIFIILITPISALTAFAEEEDSDAENPAFTSAAVFLKEFVESCPNRLAGTAKEKEAAEFIADYFQWLVDKDGYIPAGDVPDAENEEKFYQKFSFTYDESIKNSQNVIVTKQAKNQSADTKTVIIGAHYDNWYVVPESDYKMEGAYDNGTGVAVMMDLAYKLKKIDLDFNVVFIAFGAEEYGFFGSEYYVNKLAEKDLNNILIMFNLDVIGAGDKLYLYCDEIETEHEKFLFDIAKSKNINLNPPPLDKHVKLYGFAEMPYTHTGLMSDNLSFFTRRVNTAFFFTYNWEYGLSESDKNPGIMHSTNDNLEFLDEQYKETYKKFMADVSDIIYASLTSEAFEEKMISSFNNKFNYLPFFSKTMIAIVGIIILTLAGVLVILTYYFLNKNKLKKQPEVLTDVFEEKDTTVFGKDFEDGK